MSLEVSESKVFTIEIKLSKTSKIQTVYLKNYYS